MEDQQEPLQDVEPLQERKQEEPEEEGDSDVQAKEKEKKDEEKEEKPPMSDVARRELMQRSQRIASHIGEALTPVSTAALSILQADRYVIKAEALRDDERMLIISDPSSYQQCMDNTCTLMLSKFLMCGRAGVADSDVAGDVSSSTADDAAMTGEGETWQLLNALVKWGVSSDTLGELIELDRRQVAESVLEREQRDEEEEQALPVGATQSDDDDNSENDEEKQRQKLKLRLERMSELHAPLLYERIRAFVAERERTVQERIVNMTPLTRAYTIGCEEGRRLVCELEVYARQHTGAILACALESDDAARSFIQSMSFEHRSELAKGATGHEDKEEMEQLIIRNYRERLRKSDADVRRELAEFEFTGTSFEQEVDFLYKYRTRDIKNKQQLYDLLTKLVETRQRLRSIKDWQAQRPSCNDDQEQDDENKENDQLVAAEAELVALKAHSFAAVNAVTMQQYGPLDHLINLAAANAGWTCTDLVWVFHLCAHGHIPSMLRLLRSLSSTPTINSRVKLGAQLPIDMTFCENAWVKRTDHAFDEASVRRQCEGRPGGIINNVEQMCAAWLDCSILALARFTAQPVVALLLGFQLACAARGLPEDDAAIVRAGRVRNDRCFAAAMEELEKRKAGMLRLRSKHSDKMKLKLDGERRSLLVKIAKRATIAVDGNQFNVEGAIAHTARELGIKRYLRRLAEMLRERVLTETTFVEQTNVLRALARAMPLLNRLYCNGEGFAGLSDSDRAVFEREASFERDLVYVSEYEVRRCEMLRARPDYHVGHEGSLVLDRCCAIAPDPIPRSPSDFDFARALAMLDPTARSDEYRAIERSAINMVRYLESMCNLAGTSADDLRLAVGTDVWRSTACSTRLRRPVGATSPRAPNQPKKKKKGDANVLQQQKRKQKTKKRR